VSAQTTGGTPGQASRLPRPCYFPSMLNANSLLFPLPPSLRS
jgi:hypothetical protein